MKPVLHFTKWAILNCLLFTLIINFNVSAADVKPPQVSVVVDKIQSAPYEHGLFKLTEALKAKGLSFEQVTSIGNAKGNTIIVAGMASGDGAAATLLKSKKHAIPQVAEALTIWKTVSKNKTIIVLNGFDNRGIMYALLDVADRITWGTDKLHPLSKVREITEKPAVPERALSLYTMNRRYWESRFYDEAYWIKYLDMLARDRFNMFTIIFGYENGGFLAPPYPYFFNVESFPGVKMEGITAEEQERNLTAFNKIIQMAHNRGIGVTAGIWDHIYRGGVQAGTSAGEAAGSKPVYGLVSGLDGDNLIPYTKPALAKFIKLMPGLDAIQFRMHDESGLKKGEQRPFWKDVFKSIKENNPDMRLVLRAKGLSDSTIQDAIEAGVKFSLSTKYWMEQTGLPYMPTHINRGDQKNRRHGYADMLRYPQEYKMAWGLWTGGTNRILLWGDPDYASRFVRSLDIYGSGSYAFDVNEMLATKMESQPHDEKPFDLLKPEYQYYQYEFERYWDFYASYGRMGYDPQTPADVWQNIYEQHFGEKAGPVIETAIHTASKVLPRIIAACNNYAYFPTTRGWIEKQRMGDLEEYAKAQGSDIQQFANFDEEAQQLIEGGETARILSSMSSVWFRQTSETINNLIAAAQNTIRINNNKEFNSTVVDLKILANLSLYHSRRIPAAVYYCLYQRTHDPAALDSAITNERHAIAAWRQIVAAAGDVYADDLKFGIAHVKNDGVMVELTGHWKDELILLEKDLANLEKQLDAAKTTRPLKPAPLYKPAVDADNGKYFIINHKPVLSAPAGEAITINVKVSAPAGVKWVRLQYRNVNQYEDFNMLPMMPTGIKDTYSVMVPASEINPNWDFMYLIEVMNKKGRGFIYPDLNKETPYIVTKLVR
jgi:hypothetical protein